MSSSLKDLQCTAVRKVDVSSASKTSTTHPQSRQAAESPILVHHRTNHAGRLVLLAGAPGCPTGSTTGLLQWDSYREHHWIAPVGLTAAQPGPWLRPAAYSPSQTDKTDQVKPPDSGHPRLTQTKQTNSDTTPPPEEVKNRGGGARTGVPWGAKRLQAFVTLVSAAFSFATQTTSTNNVGKLT